LYQTGCTCVLTVSFLLQFIPRLLGLHSQGSEGEVWRAIGNICQRFLKPDVFLFNPGMDICSITLYQYYFLLMLLLSTVCSLLNNRMERCPSWEDNNFLISQEIPIILWKPNIHYRIHNCPSNVPILSYNNPVCTYSFSFLKTYFSIILPLTPCSSKLSPSLSCSNKPRYELLSHSCHMSRPSHLCSTNHNTPHFAVPSAPYSPTPSAYVVRLVCKTDCPIHITPQEIWQFCDFTYLYAHSF
jgi:hypothetical protein